MKKWRMEAELSQGLGATEWINAVLKTKKKTFKFSNSDFDFSKVGKTPFGINLEVSSHGVQITCIGRDEREIAVTISPSLLAELIIAYGNEAAKAGEKHPLAEAARALMRAQTSIVNRKRPAP